MTDYVIAPKVKATIEKEISRINGHIEAIKERAQERINKINEGLEKDTEQLRGQLAQYEAMLSPSEAKGE